MVDSDIEDIEPDPSDHCAHLTERNIESQRNNIAKETKSTYDSYLKGFLQFCVEQGSISIHHKDASFRPAHLSKLRSKSHIDGNSAVRMPSASQRVPALFIAQGRKQHSRSNQKQGLLHAEPALRRRRADGGGPPSTPPPRAGGGGGGHGDGSPPSPPPAPAPEAAAAAALHPLHRSVPAAAATPTVACRRRRRRRRLRPSTPHRRRVPALRRRPSTPSTAACQLAAVAMAASPPSPQPRAAAAAPAPPPPPPRAGGRRPSTHSAAACRRRRRGRWPRPTPLWLMARTSNYTGDGGCLG